MPDFFFKTTKLGYYFLLLSPAMRYVVTAAVSLCLTLMWLFFVYKPLEAFLQQQMSSLNHLATLKAEEKATVLHNQKLQKIIHTKNNLFTTIKKRYNHGSKSMTECITIIFSLANKAKLTVCSHIPHEMIDNEWYSTSSFTSQFQGSFSSITSFLQALKKSPFLINLQSVQMSPSHENFLNLTCVFNLYEIKDEVCTH